MSFLQIDNLNLKYQTPDREQLAVEEVSFTVEKGQFVSLVGPSGCGKSTILSCIAGITKPTDGQITLDGRVVTGIEGSIGYMFQSDNLLPWRTIYKNVMLGLEIQKKADDESHEYVCNLLKKYGLWDFKDSFPSRLSGGMRQRAALIRTLAVKPELLLLDEAFSALDYRTRVTVSRDVHNILKAEGKTIIMVTHDIAEAVTMSDKIILLTKRPAKVYTQIIPDFDGENDPLKRRAYPAFGRYYNTIWEAMNL